ncbi:hypothetical protein GQ44DRAFT_817332 [Phaeosphaeriaceae sp. PMI808]|nr:hypothetical protein GQ44DRAFT_817332 [Phaeosphaeriaceae sp. PMI808]
MTQSDSKPYENDDIYPVHALDDTKSLRSILVTWTICFNDVLDTDKLQSSLSRLLEIGDWRKIGGRLKLKKNGALEIHVPSSFTAERPAFSFSHAEIGTAIEDHPVARTLPKPNGTESIWPGPQDFKEFAARSDAPTTMEDLLSGDIPQISVHITSFTNATLIALMWPHTLMDVMGHQAFVNAWSLVLAGRESEVPPLLGAREDKLCAIIDASVEKPEEYMLKSKQLKGLAMLKFGHTRTICLTKKVVADLRLQAQTDLANLSSGEKVPFISDGDVLTAWTMSAVATSLPYPRPVTALHAMNARFRLPSLINAQGVFLQNMLLPGFTTVPPDVARGPIGPIALSNRQCLMEQATEPQVLACMREQRLLYIDANVVLMPFTDWTKAKLFNAVNFSPAVVRGSEVSPRRSNPPGTPVFYHASTRRVNPTARLMVVILGKDYEDNYWLTLTMPPLAWANIERSLKELE